MSIAMSTGMVSMSFAAEQWSGMLGDICLLVNLDWTGILHRRLSQLYRVL
jgi:hypothetical protein